jgi:hypothetical protein
LIWVFGIGSFLFQFKNRSHLSNEDLSTSGVHHRYVLPDSSTQALRLQRETDFLRLEKKIPFSLNKSA